MSLRNFSRHPVEGRDPASLKSSPPAFAGVTFKKFVQYADEIRINDSRETVSRETWLTRVKIYDSFTNTELAENLSEQIFNTHLPRDRCKMMRRTAELFSNNFERCFT
jgi:hypothetical protein